MVSFANSEEEQNADFKTPTMMTVPTRLQMEQLYRKLGEVLMLHTAKDYAYMLSLP